MGGIYSRLSGRGVVRSHGGRGNGIFFGRAGKCERKRAVAEQMEKKCMEQIKVYRLALKAVERDLDNTTRQIQEKPELRKYLMPEHEELIETRKTLIKKIDELANK